MARGKPRACTCPDTGDRRPDLGGTLQVTIYVVHATPACPVSHCQALLGVDSAQQRAMECRCRLSLALIQQENIPGADESSQASLGQVLVDVSSAIAVPVCRYVDNQPSLL